jgi:type 1 glutamine amidotransferase
VRARADQPLLVFSKTAGYRHQSIPAGAAMLAGLFDVDATEDPAALTPANLARFAAVVFLNTSGDVLDGGQKAALEAYVLRGGGFVGVHCAAATEYGWPRYGELVGAYLADHPDVQPATVRVEDAHHPATADLPAEWRYVDEWYNFVTSPRGRVHVLLTVDESSYHGGTMGADHPWAWCRPFGRGRAFYTAGGHTDESYADATFSAHLAGGIRYAVGQE